LFRTKRELLFGMGDEDYLNQTSEHLPLKLAERALAMTRVALI